jgi:hypothetical protein
MNQRFNKAILYTARSTPKGHVPVVELWHGCKMHGASRLARP